MENTSPERALKAPARNHQTTSRKPATEQPRDAYQTGLQGVPASIPEFKSFNHVRDPKVRRAKEYEQHLLILRDVFPQFSAGLDEQIAYARSQQDRSRVSDRDRVILHLEKSKAALRCDELSEDLNMPYATTYKILRSYLESGLVAAFERKGIAGNKPYLVYQLTHTRA
jgi:hypothetical protein